MIIELHWVVCVCGYGSASGSVAASHNFVNVDFSEGINWSDVLHRGWNGRML